MKKVSVIVPVYNAEKTLTDCLGNLVHQTLEDIELILVNDASTDGSLEILLSCERQFPDKVLLINSSENLGAGGARNLALDMAQGEYVGFVDADDMVDSHMYEKLYTAAKAGISKFSHGLYTELRPLGVHVTCVTPSWGQTSFNRNANISGASENPELAKLCIAPSELGAAVRNIIEMPDHLAVPDITVQPMIQDISPM